MEFVVSLFKILGNTIIIKKRKKNLQMYLKKNTNVHVNKIFSNPFALVPLIKVLKSPKIQMEHSHLIDEPNGTQKIK